MAAGEPPVGEVPAGTGGTTARQTEGHDPDRQLPVAGRLTVPGFPGPEGPLQMRASREADHWELATGARGSEDTYG